MLPEQTQLTQFVTLLSSRSLFFSSVFKQHEKQIKVHVVVSTYIYSVSTASLSVAAGIPEMQIKSPINITSV